MENFETTFGQYVSGIGLYSSEYGSSKDGPQVYTAANLVGKPSCYPDYGDHPQAYSLVRLPCSWIYYI